ncbi:hypothetical protein WMY93_009352 [Mugilogobius chulae]|uniref:Fork-head domain-containing protein n=1 Tax=Mugilogobius chulae TaxID=88201 RepID=A0AAW0PF46_9GOBI
MAAMEEPNALPIDPDFEPQSRPRSCTWPLPRPDISVVKAEGTEGSESTAGTPPADEDKPETQQITPEYENQQQQRSYADLISQAIENSPEKRLTLAQIYEWMVKTVPYFRDKGDSNSSAGWKNSIRHNLSLHNKFLRVHNESTGKSSWWMLNPEGGKTGKAPRRRAASMDNSSKLLKSRMRAKQTKKQAVAAGLSSTGGTLQNEGNGTSAGSDSPNSSQQFSKWGVNSNSPSSRGSLDDADMWTTFRPRTSSNASTLSGRLSPSLQDRKMTITCPMIAFWSQHCPPCPPTPLPSASTLLPRGSSFSSFHQRQSSSIPQTTPHSSTSVAVSQCSSSSKEPSFSNSLFNPISNSMPNSSRGNNHYSGHVPSSLEALLTSDSPPPNEVLLSQVDPLMQSPGGLASLGPLLMGKSLEPNTVAPMALQMQTQTHHLHQPQQPPQLQQQHQHLHHPALGLNMGAMSSANPNLGLPGMSQFGGASCFQSTQDRLPTDLDIDMFTENLDCDVDYIINTDLMDGIDFNFDPILPDTQGYTGPASTQGSSHNWVPS